MSSSVLPAQGPGSPLTRPLALRAPGWEPFLQRHERLEIWLGSSKGVRGLSRPFQQEREPPLLFEWTPGSLWLGQKLFPKLLNRDLHVDMCHLFLLRSLSQKALDVDDLAHSLKK